MGNLEIPDSWVDAALAAGTARSRMDGVWFHYEAAEAIAQRMVAVELRRIATEQCDSDEAFQIYQMIRRRADDLDPLSDGSGEGPVRECSRKGR